MRAGAKSRKLAACLILALSAASVARAQVLSEQLRVKGFSWDLQLEAGVGFGLDHELDELFLGRVRTGALYAYEPWIFNLGAIGELGGPASRGVGLQFEVNHFGGPWTRLGVCYGRDRNWISGLTIGFAIFGLEWQHRWIGDREPDDALMFELRAPLGIAWLLFKRSK